jgi:alkylated DNA repair dioxygenase AlkB
VAPRKAAADREPFGLGPDGRGWRPQGQPSLRTPTADIGRHVSERVFAVAGGTTYPGIVLQGSLFDRVGTAEPAGPRPLGATVERTGLPAGAWVDVRRDWLAGADDLFERLATTVPWHGERRRMYDRVVDVPRLLCFFGAGDALPDPILVAARSALDAHYAAELGERFATAGLCLYRDGRDSVAWHGDTAGRGSTEDTLVAIVSLGARRELLLRPRGGGAVRRFAVGHGDLLVMGGSCQRTWEHAVAKTARPVGPRLSVQYRPAGVR